MYNTWYSRAVVFLGKTKVDGSVVSTYMDQYGRRFHCFKYKNVKYRVDQFRVPEDYEVRFLKMKGA